MCFQGPPLVGEEGESCSRQDGRSGAADKAAASRLQAIGRTALDAPLEVDRRDRRLERGQHRRPRHAQPEGRRHCLRARQLRRQRLIDALSLAPPAKLVALDPLPLRGTSMEPRTANATLGLW